MMVRVLMIKNSASINNWLFNLKVIMRTTIWEEWFSFVT